MARPNHSKARAAAWSGPNVWLQRARQGRKPPPAPRKPRPASPAQHRMWQSMRVLRRFDVSQIAATAMVTDDCARRYLRALHLAAVVRLVRGPNRRQVGTGALWALARDTGPTPPTLTPPPKVTTP